MKLIKKLFIKDYKNTQDEKVRFRYGIVASLFGIITNLLLFIAKIVIGILGSSITIVADAVNNLSDVGSSSITFLGFKLSQKPADKEHPFGHQRYEQIMALIVAVIVLALGFLMAENSFERLISPVTTTVTILTYVILGISIFIKLFQMFLYRSFAKDIDSKALKASSIDSRNDAISTFTVLIAMIIINVVGDVGFSIDGIFGLLVSIFVIISATLLVKETISPLLGQMPDDKFVEELKNKILSYDGILGIHDFLIHSYGENKFFVSAHAEVSSSVDIMISHEIIDSIERDFKKDLGIILSIHLDPIETENEEVNINKKKVDVILKNINETLSFHDFRMVFGKNNTNIIFDVVIPFDCNVTVEQIKHELEDKYKNEDKNYYFVLDVDRI